jgi:hypothetical protein
MNTTKMLKLLTAVVVSAATLIGTGPAYAALLAKSPVITDGGYPSWFQDQVGLALQGCLNDPPRVPSLCFLPDGVEQPGFEADQPKDFPGNFPIEHFYFLASTPPIPLTGGGVASEVEFAVEAAFNPEIIANPNQEMFHRLRLIFSPNVTANGAGTYVIVHPWGTTVIPPALQSEPFGVGGGRGRATIDVNVGSALGNTASANDNFEGVLGNDPLFTISNFLTLTTPIPPVGFLGDCVTAGPVTGGLNGNSVQILFRPVGAPADGSADVLLGETDQFVICGQMTGLEVTPATADFGFWKLASPSTPVTFTVTNLSGVDIPARDDGDPTVGLILTPSSPEFTIPEDTDTCVDGLTALAPGNTCTFEVVFTPTLSAVSNATISIASAETPTATVNVSGTGDGNVPIVAIDGPATQFTNVQNPTISGTFTDLVNAIPGAGVASVDVAGDIEDPGPAALATLTNTWSRQITLTNLNASNIIEVTGTDLALPAPGNTSNSVTVEIIQDSIAPTVAINAPASPTNTNSQLISGTADDANGIGTVSIAVNGSGQGLAVVTGNTWSFTVTNLVPITPNTIVATAVDPAGNQTSAETSITFTPPADGRISSLGASEPSITDALMALRHAVNLIVLTPEQLAHGDVAPLDPVTGIPNPNGVVDISDALIILRRVVGLIDTF